MPKTNLNDIYGALRTDPKQAYDFLSFWFEPEELVAITSKPKTNFRKTLTQWGTVEEWNKDVFSQPEGLVELSDNGLFDTYFGVNPHIKSLSPNQRGTKENILSTRGVFADIDIKEGAFSSQKEILSFLDSLEYKPSVVVGSGSGGIHAYWKFDNSEYLNVYIAEKWWSYLQSMTEHKIDKLVDITRMMRLPGSVYLPKLGSVMEPSMVEIISFSGLEYSPFEFEDFTETYYQKIRKEKKDTVEKNKTIESDLQVSISSALGVSGDIPMDKKKIDRIYFLEPKGDTSKFLVRVADDSMKREAYNSFINSIQEKYDWSDILEPYGWTFLRELPDNAREWARPGRNERSATTDWIDPAEPEFGASGVMSLLSSSEDTNLLDLKEAEIPLTKWRVILRYKYDDDVQKFILGES